MHLIPAGPNPPNPAELLSKPQLKTMFDELEQTYDFIIIDTPPLGIISDAQILMNMSHINIYIVRENFSKAEYVHSLDELHREGKVRNVSIVLNDSDFSRRYGYSYGHNYGYTNGGYGYYDTASHGKPFLKRIFKSGEKV